MTESHFSNRLNKLLRYSSDDAEAVTGAIVQRCTNYTQLAATDFDEIASIAGESGAHLIRLSYALAERRVTDSFRFGIRHAEDDIICYLKAKFYTRSIETSFIMLFDGDNRVIGCEFLGEGTVNFLAVPPRKVLEVAIKKKAASAIIAHNHPGGVAKPSVEDIEATRVIASLFEAAGKRLLSHYVFSGNSHDVILTGC